MEFQIGDRVRWRGESPVATVRWVAVQWVTIVWDEVSGYRRINGVYFAGNLERVLIDRPKVDDALARIVGRTRSRSTVCCGEYFRYNAVVYRAIGCNPGHVVTSNTGGTNPLMIDKDGVIWWLYAEETVYLVKNFDGEELE